MYTDNKKVVSPFDLRPPSWKGYSNADPRLSYGIPTYIPHEAGWLTDTTHQYCECTLLSSCITFEDFICQTGGSRKPTLGLG